MYARTCVQAFFSVIFQEVVGWSMVGCGIWGDAWDDAGGVGWDEPHFRCDVHPTPDSC